MPGTTPVSTSSHVAELLELAGEDNLLLRTPDGRDYVMAEVDDLNQGIEVDRQGETGHK